MKRMLFIVGLGLVFSVFACQNPNVLVDENQSIDQARWTYVKPIKITVPIVDTTAAYAVFINLRHTEEYAYSNIFIRIKQHNPNKSQKVWRKEYTLANLEGEWLGTGSGNLLNHQLLLFKNHRFAHAGTYVFELEQNMRDNPLKGVSDIGLRVEKQP
ncbi:MAG: gliding motility lipoprotein GldH [Sphingobacteriaceae bacterium]